jgi:hypothetical protein
MADGGGFDLGLGFSGSNAGATGGGNVFNAAPLFGSIFGQSGSSTGDNAAGATATSAASGKGTAPTQGGSTVFPTGSGGGASFNLAAWLPWILTGVALIAAGVIAWKLFKK